MSIGFFPKIYEDELVYSALARFYERSGYLSYMSVADELFVNKLCRPSHEFINLLKPEVAEMLCNSAGGMGNLIKEHTMYQAYATFLPRERRDKALEMLCRMERNASDLLRLPRSSEERFMRYCPICVKEDRNKYGEAYWHRKHQLIDCGYCLKHHVKLRNTPLKITANQSPSLCPLEYLYKDMGMEEDFETCNNPDFLTYLNKVIWSDMELENVVKVIDSYLRISSYVSATGTLINTTALFDGFCKFYGDTSLIKDKWKIGEILKGNVFNPAVICQFSYFLGINDFKEVQHKNSTETEIIRLMQMPKATYKGVARKFSINRKTVEKVCERNNIKIRGRDKKTQRAIWVKAIEEHSDMSYTELRSLPAYSYTFTFLRREDKEWTDEHFSKGIKKCGVKIENWKELDEINIPRVKALIEEAKQKEGRPVRIARGYICRELEISIERLKKMRCCNETIIQNTETYPEYWAREVRWAIAFLREQKMMPTIPRIKDLASLTRGNIERCKPYLDAETAELLNSL